MIVGWYYLHQNGDLIYKTDHEGAVADIRESPFARGLWSVDPTDREGAWNIAVESLAMGARPERIKELAAKWGLTDEDAAVYAERVGAKLYRDGNAWCATRKDFVNLQESPAGFGDTAIEALAALAKELKFCGGLMWADRFKNVLSRPVPA